MLLRCSRLLNAVTVTQSEAEIIQKTLESIKGYGEYLSDETKGPIAAIEPGKTFMSSLKLSIARLFAKLPRLILTFWLSQLGYSTLIGYRKLENRCLEVLLKD